MTKINSNAKKYDLWSDSYDSYPNPTVAIDEFSFPKYYKLFEDKDVLEIGCGTGRHTKRLINQGNRVTGIDISAGMLSKLREKISSENLNLINDDFFNVNLHPNSYDVIVLSLVLEHIKDLKMFFKKCSVVLNDGGILIISELHPERSKAGSIAHFKSDEGNEITLSSVSHSQEEISRAAQDYNFKVLMKDTIVGNSNLVDLRQSWNKYLNVPMIQIWNLKLTRSI